MPLNFVLVLDVLHHFTTKGQARNLQVLFILPQTHIQAISLKCNSKGASSSSFFYFYCEFLSWGISFLDSTAVKASSLDRMHPAQPFPKAERSTMARLCLKPSRCITGMKWRPHKFGKFLCVLTPFLQTRTLSCLVRLRCREDLFRVSTP